MRSLLASTLVALAACTQPGQVAAPTTPSPVTNPGPSPTTSPSPNPSPSASEAPFVREAEPLTTRACACPVGMGHQTWVGGTWTRCGCPAPEGPDVYVPPTPPPAQECGGLRCAAYTEEDTEVGAKGCCTGDGRCGSASGFLFGDACLARGGDAGRAHPACPSESVNFVDLVGCCRPDGRCGLSIDQVPNFDLGCVERSEMAQRLNDGAGQRNLLSIVFFLPVTPASFPPLRCAP